MTQEHDPIETMTMALTLANRAIEALHNAADKAAMEHKVERDALHSAMAGLQDMEAKAQQEIESLKADAERMRWFDRNTTFYDVNHDFPVAPNVPVLASVSKRIWYHATDDVTSYPFSMVAAIAAEWKSNED